MAAKITKYVILSIAGLLVVIAVAITMINDETIEASVGPLAKPILAVKHSVGHGISSAANAMGGSIVNMLGGNDGNTTPRVVQALPPPPTPSIIAKPVQSKSLAEIAAETEQEYAQRQMPIVETESPSIEPDPVLTPQQLVTETDQVNASEANAPPPPPVVGTENIVTSLPLNDAQPATPETMMAEQPTLDAMPATGPVTEQQTSETELLESLNEQPTDDVATLLPESPEEVETLETATEETPDPSGEQAYAEGLKFYSGEGVERNFGTAAQYFMKAAEQGHSEAQYSLGLMNYVGQTGGQDFTNAAKWFQLAAENGHVQAQYNLGFLYYEGKGVGQDLKTAYGWIDRAAQQGYTKAVKARDALQKAMPEMFGT